MNFLQYKVMHKKSNHNNLNKLVDSIQLGDWGYQSKQKVKNKMKSNIRRVHIKFVIGRKLTITCARNTHKMYMIKNIIAAC